MSKPDAQVNISQGRYYGPCLYLGPTGQRCDRPAREDGFCNRHAPEGASAAWSNPFRIAAALALLLATIWPLLAHFLRELSSWLR